MKKNYQAWLIKEKDFPRDSSIAEQIFFLLGYAILAPSAHNSQPWHFEVHDNQLNIFIDRNKALKESDPEWRQTYESLGACLENLLIAARYFNFVTSVEYRFSVENVGERVIVAVVTFDKQDQLGITQNEIEMFNNIVNRRSAKLDYLPDKFGATLEKELIALNNFSGISLNFYYDQPVLNDIADVVDLGTREAFASKEFCLELSHFIKPAWTKEEHGMPTHTIGIPHFMAAFIPFIIAHFGMGSAQAKMAADLIHKTPMIGVISGDNNILNWFEAGRLFERLALLALIDNWYTAIMGATVEIESAASKLKKVLGLEKRPLLFFRIGHPKKAVSHSPRRPIEKCVKLY